MFANTAQNIKNGQMSPFFEFSENPKHMPRVVWAEESKTGLGYQIEPSQQKYKHKPTL